MYWRKVQHWRERDTIVEIGSVMTDFGFYLISVGFGSENPEDGPGIIVEQHDAFGIRTRLFADMADVITDAEQTLLTQIALRLPDFDEADDYQRSWN